MAKNFIQKAIKNPGGLHKALGVAKGKKIPAGKMAMALKSKNAHLRRMAQLAKTLAKLNK